MPAVCQTYPQIRWNQSIFIDVVLRARLDWQGRGRSRCYQNFQSTQDPHIAWTSTTSSPDLVNTLPNGNSCMRTYGACLTSLRAGR